MSNNYKKLPDDVDEKVPNAKDRFLKHIKSSPDMTTQEQSGFEMQDFSAVDPAFTPGRQTDDDDIGALLNGLNIEDQSKMSKMDMSLNTVDYLKKKQVKSIGILFNDDTQDNTVIDEKDMNKEIKTAPWTAALYASFQYSASQINKEKKTSCIGCSTIFLIVFITSFICVFQQNSPTVFYIIGIDNVGDADLMFLGNKGFRVEEDVPDRESAGYLYDATEANQYDTDPFSFSKTEEVTNFIDEQSNTEMQKSKPRRIILPTVNCTELEEILDSSWTLENGKQERIGKSLGLKGVYPRWLGFGNLTRDKGIEGNVQINSFFQLGDSKKEIELDVAPGFPAVSLNSEQVIISKNYANYFGWEDLPVGKELFDKNVRLTLQFDIMDVMGADSRAQLELILFDKNADLTLNGKTYKGLTRGQRFLLFSDQPQDLTWGEFTEQQGYENQFNNPQVQKQLEDSNIVQGTKMSKVIDRLLQNIKREDLVFEKLYQVKALYDRPKGKWPAATKDTIFLDSKDFFKIYFQKVNDRVLDIMNREFYYGYSTDGGVSAMNYQIIGSIMAQVNNQIQNADSSEFALTGNVKADDSMRNYFDNDRWGINAANSLMQDPVIRDRLENQYSVNAPVSTFLQKLGPMQKLIQQFFILVLICMLGLAFIVANSLITNNLEEKTYENAMLRTLGWDKSNIVLITLIKSTLFFIIPGFLIAITLLYGATFVIKDAIQNALKRQIILDFNFLPIAVGILVAYALPVLSMIQPVINGLAIELRDALDVFRQKTTTIDVQFTKLQDLYGLSFFQLIFGALLTTYGIMVYVQIPFAIINGYFIQANSTLMIIYINIAIATSFLMMNFLPYFSKFLLEIYFRLQIVFCCNRKPLQHRKLLYKNMSTHANANNKIGLTIIVLVAFQMLVRTLSQSISGLIDEIVMKVAGGDMAIIKISAGFSEGATLDTLDQAAMTGLLTDYKNKYGLVQEFSFKSNDINDIMNDLGQKYNDDGKLKKLINFELRSEYTEIYTLVQTLDENHFKVTGDHELSVASMWQPSEIDKSFPYYEDNEIVKMLFDLSRNKEINQINMEKDKEEVVNINPQDEEVEKDSFYQSEEREGQIINVVIAQGTDQILNAEVGDEYFKLCVSSLGHCFKARVIAMVRRFPTFHRFTSFYPLCKGGISSVMVSPDQFKYMVSDVINSHPNLYQNAPQPFKPDNIELLVEQLQIKFVENSSEKEILLFRSYIQNYIESKGWLILDVQALQKENQLNFFAFALFFTSIIIMLSMLAFFKMVLSIEANLKDTQQQIGILRSMGMTKKDIERLTLEESTSNIVSATIIGFFTGYFLALSSVSVIQTLFEKPVNWTIEWRVFVVVLLFCTSVVVIGTKISMGIVNGKGISQIIKGQ